jgi:opacity protein-like surface antigen
MLCAAAHADDSTAVYIGGSFGRARSSYNTGLFDAQYQSEAAASGDTLGLTGRAIERGSYVWWGDAGLYFTPYIALEAAYLHLGDIKYRSTGELNIGGDEKPTSTSAQVTSRGPALSLMGRLPLTDWIEIDLRLGDYIGKTLYENDISVNAQNVSLEASKTTSSLLAGAGVAYTFAGHWSVRLDYLRVEKTGDSVTNGKFSVNLATAGISVTF